MQFAPSFFAAQQRRNQTLESKLEGISFDAAGAEPLGVLETNELSFRYLSQAAEGGIAIAMQSLADNYEQGCGVRKSMRMCREWYWRACLAQSVGASAIIDTKSVLVNEMMATSQMLDNVQSQLQPGQGFVSGGPNLCSLILALQRDLIHLGYQLPPFAAIAPSQQVGSRPQPGSAAPPMIACAKGVPCQLPTWAKRHCCPGYCAVARASLACSGRTALCRAAGRGLL